MRTLREGRSTLIALTLKNASKYSGIYSNRKWKTLNDINNIPIGKKQKCLSNDKTETSF